MLSDTWTTSCSAIDHNFFANLTPKWQRNNALRTDLERRQALIEIDVLISLSLGLTLDELLTCYRLGFHVLLENENNTWYDQQGRVVICATTSGSKLYRGLFIPKTKKLNSNDIYAVNGAVRPKGLGFEDIKDMTTGTVTRTFMDDTLPGGPKERTITYYAPFFKMNREEDYKRAWDHFEKLAKKSDN